MFTFPPTFKHGAHDLFTGLFQEVSAVTIKSRIPHASVERPKKKKRSLRVAARTALVPCLARLAAIPASLGAASTGLLFVRPAPVSTRGPAPAPDSAARRGLPGTLGEPPLCEAPGDLSKGKGKRDVASQSRPSGRLAEAGRSLRPPEACGVLWPRVSQLTEARGSHS